MPDYENPKQHPEIFLEYVNTKVKVYREQFSSTFDYDPPELSSNVDDQLFLSEFDTVGEKKCLTS